MAQPFDISLIYNDTEAPTSTQRARGWSQFNPPPSCAHPPPKIAFDQLVKSYFVMQQ